MKQILLFYQKWCPYCKKAFAWMNELKKEHPEYAEVPLETVDENAEKERADSYDYYYVPTFYLDGKKIHEGVASKEIIEGIFKKALEDR